MSMLRALDPGLYDQIQAYKVTQDSQMPWAYQFANPQGRPYHDDWGIVSSNPIVKFLQPYQLVKRMDCAYRVPLPFKVISGEKTQGWYLWDPSYPVSDGAETRVSPTPVNGEMKDMLYVKCDQPGQGWVSFAAFIGGAWVPCFKQYQSTIGGRRLLWYSGLKQDLTVAFFPDGRLKSDLMAWFPEVSASWKVPV